MISLTRLQRGPHRGASKVWFRNGKLANKRCSETAVCEKTPDGCPTCSLIHDYYRDSLLFTGVGAQTISLRSAHIMVSKAFDHKRLLCLHNIQFAPMRLFNA